MEGQVKSESTAHEAFRRALRKRVGETRFATWFLGSDESDGRDPADGAVAIRVDANRPEIRLLTATPFEQTLVRKQMLTDLQAAALEAIGPEGRVTFAIRQAGSIEKASSFSRPNPSELTAPVTRAVPPAATPPQAPRRRPRFEPASVSPEPSNRREAPTPPPESPRTENPAPHTPAQPDRWITGDPNAAATRLCTRIAAGRPAPAPTLLWGPSGVGKTHLLRKLAAGFRARRRKALSIGADEFLRGFVNAARGGSFPAFRQKFEGLDALLLDDVQLLLGKRKTIEELRQIIDSLAERGAAVVLTADRCPNELRELGHEMASRLAGGLAVEIETHDVAMRQQLATAAAERLGVELPEKTARALAARLMGGGREVCGAVNRLVLMHETFDSPLDERLAERAADDANRLSTPPVRLPDIERAVCNVFGVDGRALRSDKRTKAVTQPRMLAMFLARQMTGSAWSEIGDYFHRKSHSTVIAAHRRVENLLAADEPTKLTTGELGETIRRIEAALRSA